MPRRKIIPRDRDYGIRHKPAGPSWLATRKPLRKISMRWPYTLLPREGTGDYRHGTALARGNHGGPAGEVPGDHRSPSLPEKYEPRRNGMPDPVLYVVGELPRSAQIGDKIVRYRAPGWERRAARNGLDLDAIAEADAVFDRDKRRRSI